MITLHENGGFLLGGELILNQDTVSVNGENVTKEAGKLNTMAYQILSAHNTSGNMEQLKVKFDKLTSHDIMNVQPKRVGFSTLI